LIRNFQKFSGKDYRKGLSFSASKLAFVEKALNSNYWEI